MISQQHTQLWGLSTNAQSYERNKNLLSGRLKNSLNPDAINAQTLENGLSNLVFKERLEVIHDGCDIRKAHSNKLENLAKVRDLSGDIINGYNTFNSLVINDIDKSIHLLASMSYSTSDPHYNVLAGAGFDNDTIVLGQISACDQALKSKFNNVKVRHLLDRGHDDQTVFEHIDSLESTFVIRLKNSRNSDEFVVDEKGKKKFVKLADAQLTQQFTRVLDKFVHKNKVHAQARLTIATGEIVLEQKSYKVLRIVIEDRKGNKLFKEPMLLITNELCNTFETSFAIYQAYLRRSKIETVFRFLKNNLGWETFRVHDFFVIQNILALCFFVAGYFYEYEKEITQNENAKNICLLANSKGKVSLHFYLEGLKILANNLLFQEFVKKHNLSQDTVNQMFEHLK